MHTTLSLLKQGSTIKQFKEHNKAYTYICYKKQLQWNLRIKDTLGDNINSAVVSFVERLSSHWRFKTIGKQIFGTLTCVLCREVYYIVSLRWRVHYRRFHCSSITLLQQRGRNASCLYTYSQLVSMSLVCIAPRASSVAHFGRKLVQVAHSDTYEIFFL